MSNAMMTYNEELVTAYIERVHSEADRIYRFAFAVVLNADQAFSCVEKTFMHATSSLQELLGKSTEDIRLSLLEGCWQHLEKMQVAPNNKASLEKVLSTLSLKQRAILVAVDVLGVTLGQAMQIFTLPEADVLCDLAKARKTVISFDFA